MAVYATPTISSPFTFTSTDAISAILDPRTGAAYLLPRVGSFVGALCAAAPAGAVWVRLPAPDGTGGGSDSTGTGADAANAYASVSKANAVIKAGGVRKAIIVGGPAADGSGEAWLRDQLAGAALDSHVSGLYRCRTGATETIIHLSGADVFTGWSGPDANGFYTHAFTSPHLPVSARNFASGTLTAALSASPASTTSDTVSCTTANFGKRRSKYAGSGSLRGWYVKVDAEIMWVHAQSNPTKTTSQMVVTRGCRGTAIAAHASGAAIKELAFPTDQMMVDKKPYVLRLDGDKDRAASCGAGEFFVDDVTGLIYMADDPSSHKVEVTTRASGGTGAAAGPNNNAAFTNFVLDGFIIENWAGPSEQDGGGVLTFGANSTLSHCVLAYNSWLAVSFGNNYTESDCQFICNGMDRHAYQYAVADLGRYLVRSTNWNQLIDIGPSPLARYASSKLVAANPGAAGVPSTRNHHYVIWEPNCNGTWYDLRCRTTWDYMFAIFGCLGYGLTHEVGGQRLSGTSVLDRPLMAGFWIERCGRDHGTNIRCSGLEKATFINGATVSADPAGAQAVCMLLDEDTREFAGSTAGQKALDGTTTSTESGKGAQSAPWLGDTYDAWMKNVIMVRTAAGENVPFDSYTGSVGGTNSASGGWDGTRLLSAGEMFHPDVNRSPLGGPVKAITGASYAAGKATFVVGAGHPWQQYDYVYARGVNPVAYNGAWLVVSTTSTTVTVLCNTSPGAYVSGGKLRYAAGDHDNFMGDLTATGASLWQWGGTDGKPHATTLAALQALADGNGDVYGHEDGSQEYRVTGKTLSALFPGYGAAGFVPSWWAQGSIPTQGGPIAGSALPGALADLIEAPGSGDRFVSVGPPLTLPWPITAASALAISTPALNGGTVGSAFTQTLVGTGGTGTGYSWSVDATAQAALTAKGMAFSAAGVLSGTPKATASISCTFTLTDSGGHTTSKTLTFAITGTDLAVSTSSLNNAIIGGSYSQTLAAVGGTTPYASWAVDAPGATALSAHGLALNTSTGVISGTVSGAAGTINITVTVTDHQGVTASKALSIVVAAASAVPTINTTALNQVTRGLAFSQTLSGVLGTGNTSPLVWSATGLPSGLVCSAGGVISGTTTAAAGNYNVTLNLRDSAGTPHTATPVVLVLTLVTAAVVITTASPLPDAHTGVAYSQQFAASGGVGAIVWAATGPPTGLSMPAGGLFGGTPTVAGDSQSFSVSATDTVGTVATATFVVSVKTDAPPNVAWDDTVSPAANAQVSGAFTVGISATDDFSLPVNAAELQWGTTSSVSSGVAKPDVACATTGPLPTATIVSGALQASANGALVVDGHTVALNELVLVKDEVTLSRHGIRKCTQAGDATHPWILARDASMDLGSEVPNAHVKVLGGTVNAGTVWGVIDQGPYTLGTTAIYFTRLDFAAGQGSKWSRSVDTGSSATPKIHDGAFWWGAIVTDSAGQQTALAARKWTVNNASPRSAPAVTVTAPGAIVRGVAHITGTAVDSVDAASVLVVTYQILDPTGLVVLSGSLAMTGAGFDSTFDSTDLQDGVVYTPVISAKNTAGLVGSGTGATFTADNTAPSFRPDHNAIGFNVPLVAATDAANRSAMWAAVAATKATLVRVVIDWSLLQPTNPTAAGAGLNDTMDAAYLASIDALVDDAAVKNIVVMLCVTNCPAWAHPSTTVLPGTVTWGALTHVPPDRERTNLFPDYANVLWLLVDRCANRAPGILVAVELWDEPNTENWMQPPSSDVPSANWGPDAPTYGLLIQGAYNAVHGGAVANRSGRAPHPEVMVIAGATGPAIDGGGPSGHQYAAGSFTGSWLAVPGASSSFDHVSHHPSLDGVLYAGYIGA